MKKIILISILVGVLILVGYTYIFQNKSTKPPVDDATTIEQGVYGVVRGTPYREMPRIEESVTPRPLSKIGPVLTNVTVQIREYFGKDQRAGKIIATTTSDEKGFYEIFLPEDTYFLTIVDADVRYVITTTGYQGKNFTDDDRVNAYEIINIASGGLLEMDMVVLQSWPQ